MEEKYKKAFREIHIILNRVSSYELDKIPKSFIEFIENNMDVNYNPKIEFSENFENSVLEETLLLLALIYRDYLISTEERNILLKKEAERLEELKETYSVDNLFKKRIQDNEEYSRNIEQKLVVIKEEKWYKKILNKIAKILKLKGL